MPEFEITFASFARAIKHHWKLILTSLLIFSLLGAGVGYWYAPRAAVDQFFRADTPEIVDFETIDPDKDYYANRQDALNRSCTNIHTYLKGIRPVTTLTEDDRDLLDRQMEKVELFTKNVLAPIDFQLNEVDAIYVPEDHIPLLIREYEDELASVQRSLIAAEQAVELLKTMDAPALDNENVLSSYNGLLSRAYNYGTLLMQQEKYTRMLQTLREEADSIRAGSRELGRMQDAAVRELNALMEEIGGQISELAQERLLEITTEYDANGVLSVTVNHTYRATSSQENFLLIWIFCTLTGLCVGAFLAVCREAGAFPRRKKSKKGA